MVGSTGRAGRSGPRPPSLPVRSGRYCPCVGKFKSKLPSPPRHVNPKISPVVRILPAPWGLPGGNWWLPLSHRVVGAPEPPSVTSVSGQETTSSICDHGGGVPRRVRGAVQKSSPPPLRPRAPFNNPPGPPCAAGVAPGGPRHPWPCLPQAQFRVVANYCDPNLAHRRSAVGPVRPYRLHDGALAKVHMRDK